MSIAQYAARVGGHDGHGVGVAAGGAFHAVQFAQQGVRGGLQGLRVAGGVKRQAQAGAEFGRDAADQAGAHARVEAAAQQGFAQQVVDVDRVVERAPPGGQYDAAVLRVDRHSQLMLIVQRDGPLRRRRGVAGGVEGRVRIFSGGLRDVGNRIVCHGASRSGI
ncbi:hypothetical protein D3C85_1317840 [compost metagenome]